MKGLHPACSLVWPLFWVFLSLSDSSPSCLQNMSPLCKSVQGLSPAWNSLQLKGFIYLFQKEYVSNKPSKKKCLQASYLCVVRLPAETLHPSGAFSKFLRLQGVEKEEEIEGPCHQSLLNCPTLLAIWRDAHLRNRNVFKLVRISMHQEATTL